MLSIYVFNPPVTNFVQTYIIIHFFYIISYAGQLHTWNKPDKHCDPTCISVACIGSNWLADTTDRQPRKIHWPSRWSRCRSVRGALFDARRDRLDQVAPVSRGSSTHQHESILSCHYTVAAAACSHRSGIVQRGCDESHSKKCHWMHSLLKLLPSWGGG